MKATRGLGLFITFVTLVACSQEPLPDVVDAGGSDGGTPTPDAGTAPDGGLAMDPGEALFRDYCISCHTIGGGPARGPDLKDVMQRRPQGWVGKWMRDPVGMAENDPIGQALRAEWPIQMPDPGLEQDELRPLMQFIMRQSAVGPVVPRAPMELSAEQFQESRQTWFNRCAGCHGTYRAGATGPDLGEARAKALGTDTLAAVIRHGTPSGMPAWGREEVLSEESIEMLAAFLQQPPPEAPPLPLEEIRGSWTLHVPVAERPAAPLHERDWQNYFGVILRNPGKVAIFDGTTKEEIGRVDTGFAAHILRSSSSGRYFYVVGRDGRVTLIDLWTEVPTKVAEVQGCFDARSVESSKFAGYEDRFLIEGCYWPSQYVVFDGLTLEPLQRVDVLAPTSDTNEPLEEVRVAAIAASPFEPLWVLALKESGHVGLVDYSKADFPLTRIAAERYLHDGGWDSTHRYFLVAANSRDQMVVVDVEKKELVAKIPTGLVPHPGRGANWVDPDFGPVNATTHLGEGKLTVYGVDPQGHPEHAWKVVREVALPSAGGLFLKTHEQSPWVLMDMPMSNDAEAPRQICAYAKQTGALERCFAASDRGRTVHFEFDRHGREVWASVWDEKGELVVYDAVTLEELQRLSGLETPTGKFNVFNTANDVY